jgi:hypothetical protein
MREDTFGPMLLEHFNSTETPTTITEAAELVGCSKQRAYVWLERNRHVLTQTGKARHGGVEYMGRDNPHVGNVTVSAGAGSEGVTVGSILTVTGMAVLGSNVRLTLKTVSGEQLDATYSLVG